LPLILFALFTSAQYLQVGAVAVVSLLTANAVSTITAAESSAVAALKSAASSASKAYAAQKTNPALAVLNVRATAAYNAANVELIQTQIDTASLLAFYVGIFSFGIGFLKLGNVMNLMGPAVISGFQSAASVTIALGQFKNIFGYGKDFTSSTHIDDLIQDFINFRGNISTRATWSGWLWIGLLLIFKYLGRVKSQRLMIRGYNPFTFFKITGPILLCIIAIVSTKLAELYLSPGCSYYDPVKNIANVYVPTAVALPSAWNLSYTPVTTTDFLGHLRTYTPSADAPGCVPMQKAIATATFLADTVNPWGTVANPWPRDRGLAITGTFGNPPTGRKPNFSLVSGELLTSAIVITLVASLESIAIAKALASKHRQRNFNPSQEYIALGIANFFGSFTGAYPISGSFSRSALNDEVGATSPVAVLVVAFLVGIVVKIASVAPIFYYLPQNALSAIVIIALTNLMDVNHFFWLLKYDRKDAGLWLTAFLAVLFQGVEIGILIAVVISLALVVAETLFSPTPELGLVPGASKRAYRSMSQYPEAERVPGVIIQRIESPILFFNAEAVADQLRAILYGSDAANTTVTEGNTTRAVVVDFSNVPYVDSAFVAAFEDLITHFKRSDVVFAVANPNSNVLHKMTITPLLKAINTQFGEDRDWVFLTVSDAVDAVRKYEPPLKPVKAPLDDDELAVDEALEKPPAADAAV